MAINKEWHAKHKMPKNPSDKEKIQWHLEHEKNCSCRVMSETLRKKMKELGFETK